MEFRDFFMYGISYISSWNSFERYHVPVTPELEFFKNLWGLGIE
jgi:hypothetical protein